MNKLQIAKFEYGYSIGNNKPVVLGTVAAPEYETKAQAIQDANSVASNGTWFSPDNIAWFINPLVKSDD